MGKERPYVVRSGSHVFTPAATARYENLVKLLALEAGITPIDGPVHIVISVFVSVRQSWSKRKQNDYLGGPAAVKPDLDNVIKSIMDGLNGVGYADDKQVAAVTAMRTWGNQDSVSITLADSEQVV